MSEEIQKELQEIKKLLLTKKNVLNMDELAKYTGYSKSHIYKLTSQNLIPYFKPSGKSIFFDRVEIDNWLLQNKSKHISQSTGKLVGDEWMDNIPNYWADVKTIKFP
jgi:prophage regulatory protein